jgi:hypothetical protein
MEVAKIGLFRCTSVYVADYGPPMLYHANLRQQCEESGKRFGDIVTLKVERIDALVAGRTYQMELVQQAE